MARKKVDRAAADAATRALNKATLARMEEREMRSRPMRALTTQSVPLGAVASPRTLVEPHPVVHGRRSVVGSDADAYLASLSKPASEPKKRSRIVRGALAVLPAIALAAPIAIASARKRR